MRKNIYILSDAHLGSWAIDHARTQERRLVRFLDNIKTKAAAVYLHQWLTPHPDAGDSIYVTSIPGCKAYGFSSSAAAAATFGGTVGSGLSHDVPPILAPNGCAVYTRGGLLIGISSGGRVYGPSYFGYALKHLLE